MVDLIEPAEQRFHHDLRLAIGVDGLDGEGFENGARRRIAVDGGAGREDHVADAGFDHGGEERERTADVVGEVAGGLPHGFADRDEGGEVNDRLRALVAHEAGERSGIGYVEFVETAGGNVVAIAFREVIDHRDIMALFEQQAHGVGADVAGAAGDENASGVQDSIVVAWRFYAKWRGVVRRDSHGAGDRYGFHAGGRSPERSAGSGGAERDAGGGYAARVGRGACGGRVGADSPATGAFAGDRRPGAYEFADRTGDSPPGGEPVDRGERQPAKHHGAPGGVSGYRSGRDGAAGGEVGGGSSGGRRNPAVFAAGVCDGECGAQRVRAFDGAGGCDDGADRANARGQTPLSQGA